jgi:DNA-directed RNA polymerase specialized sigma subunit
MAIEQQVMDSEILQAAVLRYISSNDETDFNIIYELTERRRRSMVARAVSRYSRVDGAGLLAAADDGLMDALKRYKPEAGVPFSAFMGFVIGRKIGRHVQSAYFTGKERTTERPVMTDVQLVPESVISYIPEESISETLEHVKSVDNVLYEVTVLLINGWNEETVGRVIGKRDSVQAAKSWTRRQRSKVAALLADWRCH